MSGPLAHIGLEAKTIFASSLIPGATESRQAGFERWGWQSESFPLKKGQRNCFAVKTSGSGEDDPLAGGALHLRVRAPDAGSAVNPSVVTMMLFLGSSALSMAAVAVSVLPRQGSASTWSPILKGDVRLGLQPGARCHGPMA